MSAADRKLPYPPGTRYSDAGTYDIATAEVEHGWQVFKQVREDGTETGRKSFLNNHGVLCSIAVAEAERKAAMDRAAPELLFALDWAVRLLRTHVDPEMLGGERFDLTDCTQMQPIFEAITKARGL